MSDNKFDHKDAIRATLHDTRNVGELIAQRKEPANAMEAAEHAFEAALSRLEVAMAEAKGARERLQMLRDHDQWKRVYAERAEAKR